MHRYEVLKDTGAIQLNLANDSYSKESFVLKISKKLIEIICVSLCGKQMMVFHFK